MSDSQYSWFPSCISFRGFVLVTPSSDSDFLSLLIFLNQLSHLTWFTMWLLVDCVVSKGKVICVFTQWEAGGGGVGDGGGVVVSFWFSVLYRVKRRCFSKKPCPHKWTGGSQLKDIAHSPPPHHIPLSFTWMCSLSTSLLLFAFKPMNCNVLVQSWQHDVASFMLQ